MRTAIEFVKGSEWEGVLYTQPSDMAEKRAFRILRTTDDAFAKCMAETNRFIRQRTIPLDVSYATRIRIREVQEVVAATDVEHRGPLLKILMSLHESVYRSQQERARALAGQDDGPEVA